MLNFTAVSVTNVVRFESAIIPTRLRECQSGFFSAIGYFQIMDRVSGMADADHRFWLARRFVPYCALIGVALFQA
jgi:hypothetical protein